MGTYDTSLELVRFLITHEGLEPIDHDRMAELAKKGMLGAACTDGRYSLFMANGFARYHDVQHFDRTHGAGFMLGLSNPEKYGIDRKHFDYIHAARIVLLQDLRDAYLENIGKVVLLCNHGPNCMKMNSLGLAFHNMILAGLDADDYVTESLFVSEDVVVPIMVIDWTPDEEVIRKKTIEPFKVRSTCRELIPAFLETHSL